MSQSRFAHDDALTPERLKSVVEKVNGILSHLKKNFCGCGCKYDKPGFLTAACHTHNFSQYGEDGKKVNNHQKITFTSVFAKLFGMSVGSFINHYRFKEVFNKHEHKNKFWLYSSTFIPNVEGQIPKSANYHSFKKLYHSQCDYCKSGFFKLQMVWKCLKFFKQKTKTCDAQKTFCYFARILSYYYGGRVENFKKFAGDPNRVIYAKTSLSFTDWNNIFPETHFKKKVEKKVKVSRVDAIAEHRLEQMLKKQRARQGRAEKMENEFPETGHIIDVDCYGADIRYALIYKKVNGKSVLTWCEISDGLGKSGGGGSGRRNRTSKKKFSLQAQMNMLTPGSTIRFKTRERPVGFDDAVAKEHLRDMLVKLGREHFGTVIEARHSAKEDGFKDTVDAECLEKFRLKIGFPPLAEIGDIQFGVTTNQKSQVGEGEPLFTELTPMERQQQAVKAKNLRNGLPEDYREQKAKKLAQKDAIREKKELKAKAQEEGGMVISQLFDTCPLNVKSKKTRAAYGPKTSKAKANANDNIGNRWSQATRAAAKQTLEIWGGTSCAGGEVDPDSDEDDEDTRFMPPTDYHEDDEDDTFNDEPELLDLVKKKVLISISAPTNKPLGDAKPTLETFDGWTEVKPKKSKLRRRRKKETKPQPAVAC